MRLKKIVTVLGARPQFIKAAAVSRAVAERQELVEIIVHTGQHFNPEMSDVFFQELKLPRPGYDLGISGGGHGQMTGRMMERLEAVMTEERPDWVLVYGDTNSTLAGALVATKLNIPVAHVEAGLRSFNRRMPEEINRLVTDHVSTLLFCPTRTAVANLAAEGITSGVHAVGDVMYDCTLTAILQARLNSTILAHLGLAPGSFALATIHRAENTDTPDHLRTLLDYLRSQARDEPIVLPIHPRTRFAVERFGLALDGLLVIDPIGYLDMTRLLDACTQVLTDSGGLQKEAYFHRKPCITLRAETEWTETIECGWNRLWTQPDYRPRRPIEEYGDGYAARRIIDFLTSYETY
ncbi:MAG: UDP-N-acetylglucosamine 2-epimerase (non-hydrolyzing) [Rhodospirillaceae bacterium]